MWVRQSRHHITGHIAFRVSLCKMQLMMSVTSVLESKFGSGGIRDVDRDPEIWFSGNFQKIVAKMRLPPGLCPGPRWGLTAPPDPQLKKGWAWPPCWKIVPAPLVPWLGEGLSMPSLNYPVVCAFLCHIVSLQYLSRSSLHRLAGLPCRLFLSYGLQVVTREVHRSSLRRLICPAQDHFIFLTVWIRPISMTFVLSLTQMLVFLSLYVMLSILLSILVCAAASLFCACLVSVQVSAPYVIAGSTQELYTCLFRQMARLLLKISRCLAYAAQPAMILRCISLSWFFSLRL